MTIPIPSGMQYGEATWTIGWTQDAPGLQGARGTVRFEPTAVAVPYPGVTVLPTPREARVTGGVMTPVQLEVNDPEVWNWRVTPGFGVPWEAFHVDVPAGGVDLASAAVTPGVGPVKTVQGPAGLSAYAIAVANGYQGTQAQWLASLKGDGSAWSAITGKPATFPPATHSHAVTDVTGLAARLAALEYDSGLRDIISLAPGASGTWTLRRVGRLVHMVLDGVTFTPTSGNTWTAAGVIATGFRPPATPNYLYFPGQSPSPAFSASGIRVNRYGGVDAYDISAKALRVAVMWLTDDPIPTPPLPGTPV